ncbi:MAG: DUF2612 domain-containing protein [Oscillospiraceae bacterium]|nr:DUF2612 domain-containing protein [Oscillospiraceae bacterium]
MADTDFYAQMLSDLPSQFKNKNKIDGLIYALSRQLNAVREVSEQLNALRSLRTAVGKQLDGIGNIAVLTRDEATVLALKSSSFKQMTDDIYRLYLVQKIMANMTNCTYQDIYNAMVILWGKTPIWYSESIDEPATITMTVPALSSFDETSTFLGLWEIRPAGVQLHFASTASEKIMINADFRPSAFIITHTKTGTKPRWAVILTSDGIVVNEALSRQMFTVRHEQTSENLHSGTKPTRIIFLDKDGVVINMKTSGSTFTQIFDRAGTKPRNAVIIGAEHIKVNEHGQTSRFIIDPPQTSEELHSGTNPTRIVFLDGDAAAVGTKVGVEAFGVEFERSGKEPANALLVDMGAVDVREIIDKEVFNVEATRSGTEPQPSVFGSGDAAGVTTEVSPVTYSVKYRKCGTGKTKS